MSDEFTKLNLPSVPDDLFPSFYDGVNIQQVVVLDMNHDGHLDILFHVWGDTETTRKALTNEPIPDALVVYLSNGMEVTSLVMRRYLGI